MFYYSSATAATLYSNHISSKCFVPVSNGLGDDITLEFTPGDSGMSLDLTGTGAGKLDTGSVAADTFYDIRVISKRSGDAALLAHVSGKLEPGLSNAFTMPTGYTHYSDVVFGVSCSADLDSSGTTDEIQPFSQVGPGECRYSGDAGGGYQGRGIEVLADGTQDTDSAAIDLTHTAPSPTADTSYESRGKIFIYIYGSIGGSAARTLEWLYSPDGRTTDDANSDDALEWVRVMEYLDSSGEAYNHIHDIYGLPNKVSKTTTAQGFSSDSTGTLANIFQYRFSSSGSSPDAHAWVQGWKL